MATTKNYRFETLQLHVGQEQADPTTDSRAVPIYQTTSYVFRNSQHAADRFGLRDAGNIYGRLTNTTQGVFEERIAALEGGVAALAVASGAAAITYSLQNVAHAGDHIIAADNLYGGTFNLIEHTLTTQGISTTIVNPEDFAAVDAAFRPNTKAIIVETFGNPNASVTNIDRIAEINRLATIAAYSTVLKADGYDLVEADMSDFPTVDKISRATNGAGHVVELTVSGAQGLITIAVGVAPDYTCTGISIIDHSETSGLGANAAAESDVGRNFRAQFVGADESVALSKFGGAIDALSGATITSNAVTTAVATAIRAVMALG